MENQTLQYVKEIKDGVIILTDTTYVRLLECNGANTFNMPHDEQAAFFTTYEKAMQIIPFPISLYVWSKRQNYKEYVDALPQDFTDWRKAQIDAYGHFIAQFADNYRNLSKLFFIAIKITNNEGFESARAELDDKTQMVVSALEKTGMGANPMDSQSCISLVCETLKIGTDTYEESKRSAKEAEERFKSMESGQGKLVHREVTLSDIINPKNIEIKGSQLSIEDIEVVTYEIEIPSQDLQRDINSIVVLDRPFIMAFHGERIFITLEGKGEDFIEAEKVLKNICTEIEFRLKFIEDGMNGFLSTRPFLGSSSLVTPDSLKIGTVFPFLQSAVDSHHGTLYGINRRTSDMVIIDRFSFSETAAHSLVLGSRGYGKKYFTKLEAVRLTQMHTNVVIVDLFGDYEGLSHAVKDVVFPIVDMSTSPVVENLFHEPTKIAIYSFSKIASPDAKIAAVNMFLETLVELIPKSDLAERCLVTFSSLSAAFSDEVTLKRIAELTTLHHYSIACSIITEDFSFLTDSVYGNEIIKNTGIQFLFNPKTLSEAKRINEYFGIADTGVLLSQSVGEYLLSFGVKRLIPIKVIASYTEDQLINR